MLVRVAIPRCHHRRYQHKDYGQLQMMYFLQIDPLIVFQEDDQNLLLLSWQQGEEHLFKALASPD